MNSCSREQPLWKRGDRAGHKPYPQGLAWCRLLVVNVNEGSLPTTKTDTMCLKLACE